MALGLTSGEEWESLGASASSALDGVHAVLVTGTDTHAAARVALGIGRVQARGRRVAIGDLVGEVEPLQRLVTGDDPHGIVDSFLYGVSLNKIARQVDEAGMLFVMPSGTEPVITPDIMANERWQRLAAGFKEVGALLLLVAPSEADGVRALAGMLDGVVVVGDATSVLSVPRNSVLVHVEAPVAAAPAAVAVAPREVPVAVPAPAPATKAQTGVPAQAPSSQPAARGVEGGRRIAVAPPATRGMPVPALIAAALVLAVGAWFVLGRSKNSATAGDPPIADGPTSAVNVDAGTGASEGVAAIAAPVDSMAVPRVENPQDSLRAVPYGVVLVATNDEGQALARWADIGLKLPAGTVSMVQIRGERGRFFQMQAGAFARPRQADSLLAALRADGRLNTGAGSVKATPYALMLEAKVSRRAAQNVANAYGQRQIAAYALLQRDGSATIFVGAFETAEQAVPLRNELQAKGVSSTLHYRTGKGF